MPDQVTTLLTRRVTHAQAAVLEEALRALTMAAVAHPGQVSAEVMRGPQDAAAQTYFVVHRFASQADLDAWEASPERLRLAAAVERLTTSGAR